MRYVRCGKHPITRNGAGLCGDGVRRDRRSLRDSFPRLGSAHAGAAKRADPGLGAPGACRAKPRHRQGPAGGDGWSVRTADTFARAGKYPRFRAALASAPALAPRKGIFVMSLASTGSRRVGVRRMVSRAILATWRRFLRQRRYLHELGELSAMDDLSLRDIGISRCEVRAAIRTRSDLMRR